MKRILSVVLAIVISVSMATAANAGVAPQAKVEVNGLIHTGANRPLIIGGNAYMEASEIFELAGVDSSKWFFLNVTGELRFKGDQQYVMYVDSGEMLVNGEKQPAPYALKYINRVPYLPLKWMSEKLGGFTVTWDAKYSLVIVKNADKQKSPLAGREEFLSGNVTQTHTLDSAVKQAVKGNTTIQNFDYTREELKDAIEDAEESYDDNFKYGANMFFESAELLRTINSLENKLKSLDYNESIIVRSLRLQLFNLVVSEEKTLNSICLLKNSIELAELNIKNMEIKLSVGLETVNNIKKAKSELEQSKINLENLMIKLNTTRLDILSITDTDKWHDVKVTLPEEIMPLPDQFVMEGHVIMELKDSPSVLLKSQTLQEKNYALETYDDIDKTVAEDKEDRDKLVNAIHAEERVLSTYKSDLEKSIKTNYNNLRMLEENYKSLVLTYNQSLDNYEKLRISYLVDQVTIYQLKQAELAVLQSEVSIRENRLDYMLTRCSYDYPLVQGN